MILDDHQRDGALRTVSLRSKTDGDSETLHHTLPLTFLWSHNAR